MKMLYSVFFLLLSFTVHADYGPTKSRYNYDRTDEAREVSGFWSERKMAIGMQAAGTYGVVGGVIGIHFHPQWSVDLGFGGGTHFQSYGFRIKKMMLMSSALNPYFGFGFHRWHRNNKRPFNSNDLSPGFVAEKLMSDEDKRLGIIDEKLAHASLGLQYVFTDGQLKGYGVFVEAVLLMQVDELISIPTASLGMNYFF